MLRSSGALFFEGILMCTVWSCMYIYRRRDNLSYPFFHLSLLLILCALYLLLFHQDVGVYIFFSDRFVRQYNKALDHIA